MTTLVKTTLLVAGAAAAGAIAGVLGADQVKRIGHKCAVTIRRTPLEQREHAAFEHDREAEMTAQPAE